MKYVVSFCLALVCFFATPVLAQITDVTATTDTGATIQVTAEPVVEAVVAPATDTVVVEQPVTETSLDGIQVEDIKTIPTGFGLWWRGIKEQIKVVTTFDPVKKSELRLQYAQERMNIAQKIVESSIDAKVQERAQKVVESAQNMMTKIEENKAKWLANSDERVQRLLKNVATYQLNKENILNKIEEKIPADKMEKWDEMRDKLTEKGQGLLRAVENEKMPQAVKVHLEAVKNKINEQTQIVKEFQAEKKDLLEKAKSGDETAREELEKLQEEKKAKLEEVKENFEVKKEEFKAGVEERLKNSEDKVRPLLKKIEDLKERARERLGERKPTVVPTTATTQVEAEVENEVENSDKIVTPTTEVKAENSVNLVQ